MDTRLLEDRRPLQLVRDHAERRANREQKKVAADEPARDDRLHLLAAVVRLAVALLLVASLSRGRPFAAGHVRVVDRAGWVVEAARLRRRHLRVHCLLGGAAAERLLLAATAL